MPTVEELQRELADLRSIVSDLASRQNVSANTPDEAQETTSAASGPSSPVWYCTYAQSISLVNGIADDWDPRFDDRSVATNRVSFFHPGPGGALSFHFIGDTGYHRFKMSFDNQTARTVPASLGGSRSDDAAAGYIQIKLNGQLYEYLLTPGGTAHYNLSLDLIAGRNEIVICKQYTPYAVVFQTTLFEGQTGTPVDTTQITGFQY